MMKKILFAFLFVLTATTAAFSAPGYFVNCEKINNRFDCTSVSDDIKKTHKVIKGTILENCSQAKLNPSQCPKLSNVKITFIPDDNTLAQQTIMTSNPSFAFFIKRGVAGYVLFQKNGYETALIKSETFSDNGRYVPLSPTSENLKTFYVTGENNTRIQTVYATINRTSYHTKNLASWFIDLRIPNNSNVLISSDGYNAKLVTASELHDQITLKKSTVPVLSIRVTNQSGTPLPGATVSVNGKKYTATTDGWVLNIPAEPGTPATISNKGYNSRSIELQTRTGYQISQTNAGTSGSGTGSGNNNDYDAGSRPDKITATGRVYDANTKEPLPGAAIYPKKDNTKGTVTDNDGNFLLSFDKDLGNQLVVSHLGYNIKELTAGKSLEIALVPEHITLDETSVTGADICGQDTKKKELHATATKWFKLDEFIENGSQPQQYEYVENAHQKANKQVCIPTACIDGYTLEKENTAGAFCKECKKEDIPHATKVTVKGNKCILDGKNACESGYAPNSDFTQCVVDCNSEDAKKSLNATAAAPKTNAPAIPANATAQNLDYSQYCKATACDETKYTLTNDVCESLKGIKCIGPMHEVEPRATLATFDGNGYCVLEECESGYNATKDRPTRKCDSHLTGLSCRGECKIAANTSCDSSEISAISHAISGTKEQLKDGTIVCKPTCWENYNANLNGNAYECKFASDKCPNEIIRQIKTKVSNADKMIVVATPDEENNYWKDGKIFNCKITACTKGFHANEDGTACEQNLCKCSEKWDKNQQKCVADFVSGQTPCDNKTAPKLKDYANAKTAVKTCDAADATPYCKIRTCDSNRYTLDTQNNKCEDQVGVACTVDKTISGQSASDKGQYYYDKHADKLICIPESCTRVGYQPNQKTGVCEPKDNSCPDEFLKRMDVNADDGTITEWNDDGSVKSCRITHCLNDLLPEDGIRCVDNQCGCGQKYDKESRTCVTVSQDDTSRQCNKGLPRHATAPGVQMCRNNNNTFVESCPKADKCKSVCVVQTCDNGYIPNKQTNKCEVPTGQCDFDGDKTYAGEKGTWEEKSGVVVCKPICTGTNYEPDWDAQTKTYRGCVIKRDREGKRCPGDVLKKYPHASRGEVKTQDTNGNVTECTITDCDRGYNLDDQNNQCVYCACGTEWDATSKSCKTWAELGKTSCDPMPTGAKTAVRTCKDKSSGTDKTDCGEGTCTEYCKITACDTDAGYTLDEAKNECISGIGKPCTSDQLTAVDANATAGVLRKKGDKVVCVITECNGLYTPASDGSSCRSKPMLTEQQHREKIGELSENAQKMRENETSLKNRIIGAAGIGMTGIGGAMVGDALSSRAAELSAEQDMAAYLQSMYCEYGDGKTIRGGETGVELPGGNDMIDLYTQYAQLANDLKIRKDALGIRPGIESEVVIDKAETGLYDDVGTGITGGTYASIARALLYPDGPDAAKWAQMRAATDAKLKAGAIVAGVGAVGFGVANYIVNHDVKNNADELIRKYEALRKPFANLQNNANKQPQKTCAEVYRGSTGSDLDNCECVDQNAYLTNDGCVPCGSDFKVNDEKNGCVCADPEKTEQNGRCEYPSTPAPVESVNPEDDSVVQECKLAAHLRDTNDCKCVMGAIANDDGTKCACDTSAGYIEQGNACVCDISKGYIVSGDKCVCDPTKYVKQPDGTCKAIVVSAGTAVAEASIPADAKQHTLFASGKATIQDSKLLDDFINEVKGIPNLDLNNANNYCVVIIGKTDHQGFKSTSKYYGKGGGNQKLSEERANAVKNYFEAKQIFANDAIRSYGIAATDCPEPQRGESKSNSECRRVDIKMLTGSCADNLDNPMPWLNTMVSQQAIQTVQNLIK